MYPEKICVEFKMQKDMTGIRDQELGSGFSVQRSVFSVFRGNTR